MPAAIHYPSSSPVQCSVEDVFPSEPDSFMIGDKGLPHIPPSPPAEEKWPRRNPEPADPVGRLSLCIAETLTVPLLCSVMVTDSGATEKYLDQS